MLAVKTDLVVDFKPLKGDDKAVLELPFDVVLAKKSYTGYHGNQ